MGFRSRVRDYVRSLRFSRQNPQGKALSTVPPPSSTPGVPLSPITEESVRLRAEDDMTPEPVIAQDQLAAPSSHAQRSPPRSALLEDSENNRLNRPSDSVTTTPVSVDANITTANATIPDARPTWQPSSAASRNAHHPSTTPSVLFPDQYTPLGVSKCFIVPAGKDDYLVRIIRIVHLGDLSYSRPGEIKFSAPNSYYTPAVGHCVLLQCGWRQFIARVLLKISKDDKPDPAVFRARDPHVEWSLPMILDEEPEVSHPRETVVTFDATPVSATASPYTPAISDIGLLRTPANHIAEVRERTQSPDSLSSSSVVDPTPSPAEDNPESQVSPLEQPAGRQLNGREEKAGHSQPGETQTPGQSTPEESDSETEPMASSLDDLNLQRFRSAYNSLHSSGSSAWDTPKPLPRTPPQPQHRTPLSPRRERISVSASGFPGYSSPWGGAQHIDEYPPGFVPHGMNYPIHPPPPRVGYLPQQSDPLHQSPLQSHQPQPQYYPQPGQPMHEIEFYSSPSPNGSWHYTDPVTGYPTPAGIRFANDIVVIQDGQRAVRGRGAPPPQPPPQPIIRRTRHRQSATVPLPPTSPEFGSGAPSPQEREYGNGTMGVAGPSGSG